MISFSLRLLRYCFSILVVCHATGAYAQVKIKDTVYVEGMQQIDLIGYGLVIGLDGTGDTFGYSSHTNEALLKHLDRLNIKVTDTEIEKNNIASVLVTADLPPIAVPGGNIGAQIMTLGDAKTLNGGKLLFTPLSAGNGEIYAIAEGPILASGIESHVSARIERGVKFDFTGMNSLNLELKVPNFAKAEKIETLINASVAGDLATMVNSGVVSIDLTRTNETPLVLMNTVLNLQIP